MRSKVALLGLIVAGCGPSLPELDGAPVVTAPSAAYLSVGGTGPDDVWAVGAELAPLAGGQLVHWDGAAWSSIPTATPHDLWWVHAFEGGPVFVGGAGNTVLRVVDGVAERLRTPGFAGQTVYGVWGASPDDLWAVGGFAGRAGFVWRWDGTAWTEAVLPSDLPRRDDGELPPMLKVWGRSADDVWVVGGAGTVLHWDGSAFEVVPSGTTEVLFTVHGDADEIVAVGGGATGVVLRGGLQGLRDDTPAGAPLLQGVRKDEAGNTWVAGADGAAWGQPPGGSWQAVDLGLETVPGSVHALWTDGEGGLWSAGGNVLTPTLDAGVIGSTDISVLATSYAPPQAPPVACPEGAEDPRPEASIARRWNEQLLNSIRRDVPMPGVHARNLFHSSLVMWDAWAMFQGEKPPVLWAEGAQTAADVEEARRVVTSYAMYRLLKHRYQAAQGGPISVACYDAFMDVLGLDPEDTRTEGDDPVAIGNRLGQLVIGTYADDGANEAEGYKDTTGWTPTNPVMIVDEPGCPATDPNIYQQLNLASAETQNGIVLDTSVQGYIGAHWREVRPWAAVRGENGLYSEPRDPPDIGDAEMVDWVVEVIRKTAELDVADGATRDYSPGAFGNNPLGTNDGTGYDVNPFTDAPYAPNVLKVGDFTRVLAEYWADGPKSETPPGHWVKISNEISDRMADLDLPFVPYGGDVEVDRHLWDVGIYLAVSGAVHDAAITSWELKREFLGARPITLVRWMGQKGQRSDSSLPSYDPGGLPLVDGLIELITEESSAPGERHFHLRWYVGELAVRGWPGEPGRRADEVTPIQWIRVKDWIPYQRRTFVTPAFPGFTSGHSTFSRAAAEALTAFTGTPYYPGGFAEFVAVQNGYLVFEEGPSTDVRLQWATYYDAADQAGQSRLHGGIHIQPDDFGGRVTGRVAGLDAVEKARSFWEPAR